MKTSKSLMGLKQKGGALLMMAIGSVMFSEAAFATSAGTVLRNTVTVNYKDSAGSAQAPETSSVDVTVDLVASVVWGAAPTGVTVVSGGTLPAAYSTTLTNTGNGLDTYNLSDTTTETCVELSTQAFSLAASITLGATVSAGAAVADSPIAGQTTIPVSNINAVYFNAGAHTVIINNLPYVVLSAAADGNGTTVDSLVVIDPADIAATYLTGAGFQIGERKTVDYGTTGAAGTLDPGTTTCDHDHVLTATGTLSVLPNIQATDTLNGWSTTVELVEITINKYVRNVTTPAKHGLVVGSATWNSQVYYDTATNVTADPGDVLEYLVVIENTGAGLATDVIFQDTLPPFTTLNTATVGVDNNNDNALEILVGTGGETVAAADGVIVTSGSNLRIFVGADITVTTADDTGATATTGGVGGGIAQGDISNVVYQMTIQDFAP